MEEKIKEIVAVFIRVPAEQIGHATPIDRRAVKSSIMLHRMYARLSEDGFIYRDYNSIRVFGDLLRMQTTAVQPAAAMQPTELPSPAGFPEESGGDPISMGIDIESAGNLPRATDFRREDFYKMNFSPQEIAYCILQADPYSSFAGLFAAKEALIKADASLRQVSFNQIVIGHTPEGRPVYPGFTLSIAHSDGVAVAVAARGGNSIVLPQDIASATLSTHRTGGAGSPLVWLAVLLAAAALIIALSR